ncbi:hypothetical protein VTN31DRAFT_2245 [Thermomyces dupontii]|uniref:uncharacterized protein n=1 Tax=Talaromyces thermophilus TaxID=28565 RepID=UPI00374392A9
MVSRTVSRMAGFIYRENRVPYYQRLYQAHDGKRQWWKSERSPYILYPYFFMLGTSGILTLYGLGRAVFGKKTFFGKN